MADTIGRYQILEELGRGGMAIVYRARDPRFDREVALKVISRAFMEDPQFRERFEREAHTIAMLEHPAIVPVYDFGEEEGQLFLVMRLMRGGTLEDRLKEDGISLKDTLVILERVGAALDAAHKKGIIHRDLKPANILFDEYGAAYLSDFGIARLQESQSTLTGSGIIGTPAYMSPEQVEGVKDLDGRSDIYALGIILFQMLTGQLPFHADTPASLLLKHLTEPVAPPSTLNPSLPPVMDAIIAQALAKDRNERYSTAKALVEDFRAALQNQPVTAMSTVASTSAQATRRISTLPTTRPALSKPALRMWLSLAAIGGLALIAMLAIFGGKLFRGQSPPTALAATVTIVPTRTQAPVVVPPTNTPQPTPTPLPPTPTATLAATLTPTPLPSPTPSPSVITLGGAQQVAFIAQNNIWLSNLDGSDLRQLTTDGNQGKKQLQWTPDGQLLLYIEGRCLRSVTAKGFSDLITCFDSAEFFDAARISPDGSLIALSVDRSLYILPFDLEKLRTVSNHAHLRANSIHAGACQSVHEAVLDIRWSADGKRLQLKVQVPERGRLAEVIRLMRVSSCSQSETDRLNEIPAQQFTMKNYRSRPIIPSYDWDGAARMVLHDFYRNDGFGDLYIYDTQKRQLISINGSPIINPVSGTCCYRDPRWSPDGTYLLFVFQDINTNQTTLYYVRYGLIGAGSPQPIPLPAGLFNDPRVQPQPALRPAP